MFERWNEMLKDQPDWLEVSLPPGSLQSLESNLASLGVTKEHAMGVFIDWIAEAVMKDSAVRIQ